MTFCRGQFVQVLDCNQVSPFLVLSLFPIVLNVQGAHATEFLKFPSLLNDFRLHPCTPPLPSVFSHIPSDFSFSVDFLSVLSSPLLTCSFIVPPFSPLPHPHSLFAAKGSIRYRIIGSREYIFTKTLGTVARCHAYQVTHHHQSSIIYRQSSIVNHHHQSSSSLIIIRNGLLEP